MPKLFDRAVGKIETYIPSYEQLARESRLFWLDVAPHEALPKEKPEWFDEELFQLPFPKVAIEDRASVIFVEDLVPGQIGLGRPRRTIEHIWSGASQDAYYDGKDFPARDGEEDDLFIEMIVENMTMCGARIIGVVSLRAVHRITNGRYQFTDAKDLPAEVIEHAHQSAGKNIAAVFQELVLLSQPKFFVMEKRPLKTKTKKIPRTQDRPTYTMVTAHEFRTIVGLREPKGSSSGGRAGGERRAHLRRLSTEGGWFKENKTIPIPATWVGPSEKTVGKHVYKVIL